MSKPSHSTVGSTTSKSWMTNFVRRESELTSSFALTLQIQRIMARSLRRRRFSGSAFMAQVSAACSITLLTHDEYTLPLVRRGTWRLVRRVSNCWNLPHAHLQRVIAASSQPPPHCTHRLLLPCFSHPCTLTEPDAPTTRQYLVCASPTR